MPSAGNLMVTTVLRILKHTDIVTSDKRLAAYIERCTARPAFKRAFDCADWRFQRRCIASNGFCRLRRPLMLAFILTRSVYGV